MTCCNYPEHIFNGLFSQCSKYNYFLATNNTYSKLGSLADFCTHGSNDTIHQSLCQYLPMGYTSIFLYERQCIINKGKLIWTNHNLFQGLEVDNRVGQYTICDQNCDFGEWFNEREDAVRAAVEKSKETKAKWLVVRCIVWDSWH